MSRYSQLEIERLARCLQSEVREPAAVVLIGSVARNCARPQSDVDLLVVAATKPALAIRKEDFEFHLRSEAEFYRELEKGDDFPNWCSRFGIPLSGGEYWKRLLEKAEHSPWPEWRRKIKTAARGYVATELLLQTADPEAAMDTAKQALDHLIRGILLRDHEFPLSRPELPRQVTHFEPAAADQLSALLREQTSGVEFGQILRVLSETLKNIDSDLYYECHDRVQMLQSAARLGKDSPEPVLSLGAS